VGVSGLIPHLSTEKVVEFLPHPLLRDSKRKGPTSLRRIVLALTFVLFAVGAWQFARGLYIQAKACLAQVLMHRAWQRTLAGEREAKPWPWADTWPVARLRIEKQGVDVFVLAGANGRALAFGPGHVFGTPLPGAPGNSVIGGHRDTHLAFLRDTKRGSELEVQQPDGSRRRYRVERTMIVDKTSTWVMSQEGETRLTLITCYPFDALRAGGPLRYVVSATALSSQGDALASATARAMPAARLRASR
jgi:sortase A